MEAIYESLIKSSGAYAALKRDCETRRLSHAYLLVSPDRLSLDMLADMFLALAIRAENGSDYTAGVYNHTLGDITRLPSEDEKVKVADINHLTETAYYTPTELRRKYYVISYGETMNEASQNKLLKTLEEPPAVTGIIIKASSESKLLPTVLSRCRKVTLEPFSTDKLKDALSQKYPSSGSLDFAAETSKGLLTRAEQVIPSPLYPKLYEIALQMLLKLNSSGGAAEYAFKLYDYRENLSDIIDFIELLLRDAVRFACGAEESRDYVSEIAARYPVNVALKEFEVFARARRRLELNGNVTAIIDELVFSMLEVRAKWK